MAVPLIAYGLYAGGTALAAWLLGTQNGCGGNPASSGNVEDHGSDDASTTEVADGTAIVDTYIPPDIKSSEGMLSDAQICEEPSMCMADTFSDAPADTFADDAGIDTFPKAECKDLDPQNDPYTAGAVVFLGEYGLVSLYDTCKVSGLNGILMEVTCNGYHGKDTTSSELETKYIKCNCEGGVCIEESAILCTDPEAGVYYPGGSVWMNDTGKTHISVCNGDFSVDWYYCNDDGTFHADTEKCDEGVKCGDGMCGGYTCMDSEPPGADPDNSEGGELIIFNPTTGDWALIDDDCHYGNSAEDVEALKCPLHTSTDEEDFEKILEDEISYDVIPCPDGTECVYGMCKEIPEKKCEDTDPEDDIHLFGTVTYSEGDDEPKTSDDDCGIFFKFKDKTENGKLELQSVVFQDFCKDDGGMGGAWTPCPEDEVCHDGICVTGDIKEDVKYICEEYDGGIDPVKAGSVDIFNAETGNWIIYSADSCLSNKEVAETYCDGNEAYQTIAPCPDDYFCVEGTAVLGGGYGTYTAWCETCVDTDEQDDKMIAGNVTDIYSSHVTDFCNTDNKLKQAYCNPLDGTVGWSEPEDCPEGTACIEGACK